MILLVSRYCFTFVFGILEKFFCVCTFVAFNQVVVECHRESCTSFIDEISFSPYLSHYLFLFFQAGNFAFGSYVRAPQQPNTAAPIGNLLGPQDIRLPFRGWQNLPVSTTLMSPTNHVQLSSLPTRPQLQAVTGASITTTGRSHTTKTHVTTTQVPPLVTDRGSNINVNQVCQLTECTIRKQTH